MQAPRATCGYTEAEAVYEYQPSRSGEIPKAFLAGFHGYLQTDGYAGYHKVTDARPQVIPVGCMAHARRKFDEALKALPKDADAKHAKAAVGLAYCNRLFAVERACEEKELDYEARRAYRMEHAKPVWEAFLTWANDTLPQALP